MLSLVREHNYMYHRSVNVHVHNYINLGYIIVICLIRHHHVGAGEGGGGGGGGDEARLVIAREDNTCNDRVLPLPLCRAGGNTRAGIAIDDCTFHQVGHSRPCPTGTARGHGHSSGARVLQF